MRTFTVLFMVCMVVLLAAGCTAGPNSLEKTADGEGKLSGFWKGLWHGFISPVTFLVSLFTDKVHLYEVHNNGNWYNFGFVLGAGLFLSGGILGRKKNGKH